MTLKPETLEKMVENPVCRNPIVMGITLLIGFIQLLFEPVKKVNGTKGFVENGIKENSNTIFYVIRQHKNKGNVLRMYVDFYTMLDYGNDGIYNLHNINFELHSYLNNPYPLAETGKYKYSVIIENMDMFFMNEGVNKKYGNKVKFSQLYSDIDRFPGLENGIYAELNSIK